MPLFHLIEANWVEQGVYLKRREGQRDAVALVFHEGIRY